MPDPKKIRNVRGSLFLLICLAVMSTACGQTITPALSPVTVQLAWTHNAQFAGMYLADQQGYYAAEGLAVTFLEGGPGIDPIQVVESGQSQFSVSAADVFLVESSKGKPVSAIAVIFRRSPRVYVSLAGSGITRPQDFIGKTISVNSIARPPFEALMKNLGIQSDQYTLVNSTSDMTPFYSGQVQVRSVYLTNEVLAIRAAGHEINIIYPDDYGIHNYGDTLVVSNALTLTQPDLVLRFLRATLQGWTSAVENPSSVGSAVLKYNSSADPSLENQKMLASLPLINTGEDYIGWMRPEIWVGMEQMLRQQGELTSSQETSQVINMQFLKAIYR
jgi:NitT/TauT family transport system substrate-binding protein